MNKKKLRITALFIAVLLSVSVFASPVLAYDKSYTSYVSGHGHIDTAWQWNYARTISDLTYNTWAKQLGLMEKNPDYKFSASSAQHYEWMKEYYPTLFNNIKDKINSGQWDYVGGEWVEADTNIPSGESMVRQFLEGQLFFKKEFGKVADVAFLPDDPGHSWILPQIALKSGTKAFTATRISALPNETDFTTWGMSGYDNFNWKGVDGTIIPAYKPTPFYTNDMSAAMINKSLDSGSSELGIKKGFFYGGDGDMGGGPTQAQIDNVHNVNNDPNGPTTRFSKMIDYFDSLTEEEKAKIPEFNKELYYNHELGLYTTHGDLKRYNNDNEVTAEAAEKLNSLTMWLGAASYPAEKLDRAWKKILVSQHHDILPGCSIDSVIQDAWSDAEVATNLMKSGEDYSMAAIASRADTTGPGVPIVVFNSLSYERTDIVETEVTFASAPAAIKVYDSTGSEIPSQATINGNTAKVLFIAKDVPSVGYAVYHAEAAAAAGTYNTGLTIGNNIMENDRYIVELNGATGNVKRIFDKENNREVLETGKEIELQKLKDDSQESDGGWQAWIFTWADQIATPAILNNNPAITLLETGPVRATYEVTKTDGSSTFKQRISLYSDIGRVDFPMTVDWHETNKMIKASFPLAVSNPNATFDLSYGTVERGNRNPDNREVPAQKWADITNTSGDFGVSILSECKYGWDKVDDNTLRLSLLRAAKNMDSDADMGVHNFTYSIYSHASTWADGNTPREAGSMAKPFIVYQDKLEPHPGGLGKTFSFVTVDKPNITVAAIKKAEAENSDDLIVRLYESQGRDNTDVNVAFAGNITSLHETNLIEEDMAATPYSGNSFSTSLHKYELKTFRVKLDSPYYDDTKPVVTKVNLGLEYNQDGISHDSDRADGDMDLNGHTVSAEQLPDEIVSEDISFAMGPKQDGQKNVVMAAGQTIPLNSGSNPNNALYILGTSVNGPQSGDFSVQYDDGISSTAKTLQFNEWTAMIGGFGLTRITDKIGYAVSHRHNPWGDDAYRETYLYVYKITLDPAKTASSITLPDNPNMKIFAMSLASGGFLPAEPNVTVPFVNNNVTVINDDSPLIKYGGHWTNQDGRGANIGGDVHYADDVRNNHQTVEFSFIGTGIEFITEKGNDQGDVEVYIDDILMDTVNTLAASPEVAASVYSKQDLPLGEHRIKLVAATGYWAIFDAFKVTNYTPVPYVYPAPEESALIVNDDAGGIEYTGNWLYAGGRNGGDYKSDIHYTQTIGDYCEFTFMGTGIDFISEKDPEMGAIDIYIDGIKDATVSCAASRLDFFQTVYSKTGLTPGKHVIRLVLISGSKLTVDGFQVTNNPVAPSNASIVNNNDSAVTYSGGWNYSGSRGMGDYLDDVNYTATKGSYCEYTFTGTGIYLYSEMDTGLSDADIYIDGTKDATIHLASTSRSSFYQVYGKNGLPYGTHKIKVVNALNDRYLIIDAFKVSTNTTGALTGIVNTVQGSPLANVGINLSAGGNTYPAVTDQAGVYTISGVEAGAGYVLSAQKAGYRDGAVKGINIVSDGTAISDIIVLDPLAPADASVINDDDGSLTYSSGWNYSGSRSNGDYMNDVHYTDQQGSYCEYTFTGTGIYFYTEMDHGLSDADIYIDDVKVRTVHLSSDSPLAYMQVYGLNGLPYGQHTIKIVNALGGKYLIIDAFKVSQNVTGAITGIVKDIQGSPLEGANVTAEAGGTGYTAATDAAGAYTIGSVPAGTGYTVTAGKAGYLDGNIGGINVISDSTTEVGELALEPAPLPDTGKITGRVIDTANNPIPGANVSINVNDAEYSAITDASGHYTLVNIPSGTGYTLTVTKAGYQETAAAGIDVISGNTTIESDLVLSRIAQLGTITGRVLDSSHNPVAGAAVAVKGTGFAAATDSDGGYTIANVPTGITYTVTAVKPGYQASYVSGVVITAGDTVLAQDIILDPFAPENALFIDGDDSSVTYSGNWGYSDNRSNGDFENDIKYTMDMGAYCEYTFTGTGIFFYTELDHGLSDADIYIDGEFQRTLHLASDTSSARNLLYGRNGLPYGQHTIRIVNALNGRYLIIDAFKVSTNTTGSVTGRVMDNSSNPLQGVNVKLTADGNEYLAATDAEGTYTIGMVPSGTGFSITASKTDYQNGSIDGINVISDNTTYLGDLVLTAVIKPGTGIISGKVLDAFGDPVQGAVITISSPAETGNRSVTIDPVETDDPSVTSGSAITVDFTTEGDSASADDSTTTGDSTTESSSAITNASGDYLLNNLKAGTGYLITASKTGYQSVSIPEVTVIEGEITVVDNIILVPVNKGMLSGKVTDEYGNPVEGATVYLSAGNKAYTAITNTAGIYTMTEVSAGTGYTLSVAKAGYQNGLSTGINVTAGEVTQANVILAKISSGGSDGGNNSSGGNSSNGSNSGYSNTGTASTSQEPAAAAVSPEFLKKAFETAKADKNGVKTVAISSDAAVKTARGLEYVIPAKYLTSEIKTRRIRLETDAATIDIPGNMLTARAVGNAQNITICISQVETGQLGSEMRKFVGTRPVIDLTAKVNNQVITWNNPDAPVTVYIPYTPTREEMLKKDNITVWHLDDKGNATAVPSARYDSNAKGVIFNTTHFSKYAIVFVNKNFSDIKKASWMQIPVEIMAAKGIIEGTSEAEFSPGRDITRGEFIAWLIKTLDIKAAFDSNFDDVGLTNKYYEQIGTAKKLGITAGVGENKFEADRRISRQDMMVLTVKALRTVDNNLASGTQEQLEKFSDKGKIAKYASADAATMVMLGYINGDGKNINPVSFTTRAEAAAMLYSIYFKQQ